ncbi:hypothetical protein L226DRAFT_537471 [Lentinus tigrinus ALCF2SS1-7]|uniref:Uncharacterized protein n=1 Tax=Lentinus tigrinus ALCF2SS1-6 TaxID=1328759 RepID=A0A5C2S1Q4_9APHY|nr:hypothetical protein L227DRAFT_577981 [Lentinus tigrinus ALCF2SS1-6]RPD72046.1 hypothetical protein L226DRAFT_537471 [Lentinus tigrinus ALCF2SS1-7]
MAIRTRLSIGDILHRGLVWSLFGVSVWGIVMIGVVHRNTLAAGRGALAKQEALTRSVPVQSEEEKNEIALAEAAQAALKSRPNPS